MSKLPQIETAVDCAMKPTAYLAKGKWLLPDMLVAVKQYDGTILPAHTEITTINAGLECFYGCGFFHNRTTRGDGHLKNCDGDDESWVWNFKSGPHVYTIVPALGLSLAKAMNQ